MASLRLTQTRSVVTSAAYHVANVVDQNVDIPAEVFVFSTATGQYDHVASVNDLLNIPDTTQAAAQAAGNPYYRQSSTSNDWTMLRDAQEFSTMVRERLKFLVVEYSKAETSFIGTTTETYTS
jgi:hypothetical protein